MIETLSSSPTTSSLSIPRKVCMIFPAPSPEFKHGFDIFIVDLNTDLSDLSQPTIRVVGEGFKFAAFCVLGTTLFVFEGRIDDSSVGRMGKTVYNYDFSNHNNKETIVISKKKDLKWVCRMNDFKLSPNVVPTPDGKKIVVFSTKLFRSSLLPTTHCHFELFDPYAAGGKPNCKKLPNLPTYPTRRVDGHGWVQLFAFLNKDVFGVQTSNLGMFQLNLVDDDECWKPFRFIDSQFSSRFQVIGDDICLSPRESHQLSGYGFVEKESQYHRWYYTLPAPSPLFLPESVYYPKSDITLLDQNDQDDDQDQNRLFCVLHRWTSMSSDTVEEGEDTDDDTVYVANVLLVVYKYNVTKSKKEMVEITDKYREEIREKIKNDIESFPVEQREKLKKNILYYSGRASFELPGTELVKSFLIKFNPQPSELFYLRSFFSIASF